VNSEPITVFLVDDDSSVLKATRRALKVAGYEVEVFSSALEFLERPKPDGLGCLIVDLRMPGMNGLELQETLLRRDYDLPLIFLSGDGDVPSAVRAMRAGAVDFLTKPYVTKELLDVLEKAIAKHREFLEGQKTLLQLRERFRALTPREQEVCVLVGQGLLNKQVAAELGTAEKTVKIHRARVMQKLHVSSVAELVRVLEKLHPGAEALRKGVGV
jgi:FixJ family two-component response regulator